MATNLKSLAHPDWPYAGTDHAWRGFGNRLPPLPPFRVVSQTVSWMNRRIPDGESAGAIYQRLNLGPELP